MQHFDRKTHQNLRRFDEIIHEKQVVPNKRAKIANMFSEPARNWIMVEINDKIKKIMIDTGAARSVMDLKMLQSIGMSEEQLNKTRIALFQADGSQAEVLGTTKIIISVSGYPFEIDVIVVVRLHNGFLLGVREMTKMEAEINLRRGLVSFFGGRVSVPLMAASKISVDTVRTATLRFHRTQAG